MSAMNEAMKSELNARGETIVNEFGNAARSLLKNSELHELMKSAKSFVAVENSIMTTHQMFKQMGNLLGELQDKVQKTETSLKELDKICALFSDTEKIYKMRTKTVSRSSSLQNVAENKQSDEQTNAKS